MEWNFKAPSTTWDLVEMDQTTLTNMETNGVDGSSRYGDFSVDLKLGHVGNSNSKAVVGGGGGVSKMTSSSGSGSGSGSSKRARGFNNGIQTVLCLVDGCQADLSNCRDYHRRHKVCELHSKTAQVTIGGHKQRFCQQCSRFHSLEEFDEGKRSCRKRLDGHNRRRRKPQAEPITRSGSFLSNYQGTQLLPFSSSHMYPSTAMVNPSWGGGSVVTSSYPDIRLQHQQMHHHHHHHHHHLVDKQDLYLGSSPTNNNYKEVKNMSFIQQGGHSATLSNNQNQHLIPSETFRRNNNPFSVNDSTCALSLLSSTQQTHHHHHDHANGLNQQMMNNHHSSSSSSSTSFMQPLGLSLHDHHSSLGSVDPVLGSSGSDHCSSMYEMGSSESQGNEAPPLFPFQWE